jgi:hypothetical protein
VRFNNEVRSRNIIKFKARVRSSAGIGIQLWFCLVRHSCRLRVRIKYKVRVGARTRSRDRARARFREN